MFIWELFISGKATHHCSRQGLTFCGFCSFRSFFYGPRSGYLRAFFPQISELKDGWVSQLSINSFGVKYSITWIKEYLCTFKGHGDPDISFQWMTCRHFNNAFFARVGGVSVVELNRLELEFLFRLDFRLSVTTSVFESYLSHLEKEVLTLGKKSERTERSLPTFGSVSPTVAAKLTSFQKKRVTAADDKSQLNSSQLAVQYQQSIARMMARESSSPNLWTCFVV